MNRRSWLALSGYILSVVLIIWGFASENLALVLLGVVILAIVLMKTG